MLTAKLAFSGEEDVGKLWSRPSLASMSCQESTDCIGSMCHNGPERSPLLNHLLGVGVGCSEAEEVADGCYSKKVELYFERESVKSTKASIRLLRGGP